MSIDPNDLPPESCAIDAVMDSAEKLASIGSDLDGDLCERFRAIVLKTLIEAEGVMITDRDGTPRAYARNLSKAVALDLLSAKIQNELAAEAAQADDPSVRDESLEANLVVRGCSACGKDHKIGFRPRDLMDPPGSPHGWTHVGLCENMGRAVYLKHTAREGLAMDATDEQDAHRSGAHEGSPEPTTWVSCGGCEATLEGVPFDPEHDVITTAGLHYIRDKGWRWNGIGWSCPTCTSKES